MFVESTHSVKSMNMLLFANALLDTLEMLSTSAQLHLTEKRNRTLAIPHHVDRTFLVSSTTITLLSAIFVILLTPPTTHNADQNV